jgi:hypothetical protein
MRSDPNELPIPSDGESPNQYPAEELRSRAEATSAFDFPHIEAIVAEMRRLRATRRKRNNTDLWSDEFYGSPKLVIVDEGFDVAHERPWDHSVYALEEAAEIGKSFGGLVFVEQDICLPAWPNQADGWIDEGFSIEVWPRFRVRP